jgi:hypothetical protein
LQQSESAVQICPYSAQPGVLASVPASRGGVPGGGVVAPQTPWVEPIFWMHVDPGQQSPLMEQGPATGTQDGTPPSRPLGDP